MADPKGLLVVPIGFRADGSIHALELDNNDRLKVLIDSITGSVTVVQSDPSLLRTSVYGLHGGTLHANPVPFGPSGSVARAWSNTNLSAGDNDVDDSAVPSATIWVITNLLFVYVGTPPTNVGIVLVSGATLSTIFRVLAPASSSYHDRQVFIVMGAGDKLRANVVGATAGNDIFVTACGYKIDL